MGVREQLRVKNNASVAGATSPVPMIGTDGGSGRTVSKIPARGHFHWTLTSIKSDAGAANVLLKGTNNPDPASATGETLITNAHAGSDQKDGKTALPAAYDYVFVDVSAATFAAGSILVVGSGFP